MKLKLFTSFVTGIGGYKCYITPDNNCLPAPNKLVTSPYTIHTKRESN